MRRGSIVALALCAGLGCKKKEEAPAGASPAVPSLGGQPSAEGGAAPAAAPAPPAGPATALKYGDTSQLWALAPPEATFGVVIADGFGPRVLEIFNKSRKQLESKPFAKKFLDELARVPAEAGFDVFDPAAYKTQGWDISKGLAVFGGGQADAPMLFVMPVADIRAVQKSMKDMEGTIEKVGDREVFKGKEVMCAAVGDRYACAPTLAAIDAAFEPHDSPLAAAVKALPAEARGDLEGYVDITKTPAVSSEMDDLAQLGDFTTAGGAIRLDTPGINVHLWANGSLTPIATSFAAAPPPADLAAMTANATTVLRARVAPQLLFGKLPANLPLGTADVRTDLVDQLTGDIQVVTAGKGLLAGALMFKLADPARVKKVVAAACEQAKSQTQIPVANLVAGDGTCSGEISLAMLKEAAGVDLPPFKFQLQVKGNLFLVALGDLDPATLAGSVVEESGSPEARQALTGPQSFVLWSRGFTVDLGALPAPLVEKINAEQELADALALMNWSGSQVYDVSIAGSLTPTGVRLTLHATSMEADVPAAHAAYQTALDKRLSGDRAGYAAAMAEIEKQHPTSLAARLARLERAGTPLVGPVVGLAVGLGAGFAMMARGMGSAPALPIDPPATPPDTGGSFGDPAAPPPPAEEPPPPPSGGN